MSCLGRNVLVSALSEVRSSEVGRGSYQKGGKKKLNILVSFILGPI